MRAVELHNGSVAGYIVQPMLPADHLATTTLRLADPEAGHPLIEAVASAAAAAVGPHLGLDAQLANWTWDGDELTYFDVSTPLIWSPEGDSQLDLDLLAGAYPAILRWPLRRFVAPGILDTYRDLRKVYLDLAGNLLKDGFEGWLPAFLDRFNAHLDEPLTEDEVRRYSARTPGSGPPCSGSEGSIAPGAVGSGGGRTPSCCQARSGLGRTRRHTSSEFCPRRLHLSRRARTHQPAHAGLWRAAHLRHPVVLRKRNGDPAPSELPGERAQEESLAGRAAVDDGPLVEGITIQLGHGTAGDHLERAAEVERRRHPTGGRSPDAHNRDHAHSGALVLPDVLDDRAGQAPIDQARVPDEEAQQRSPKPVDDRAL